MSVPNAWKQLRYHPVQDRLWRSTCRFAAVVAGRGSGKTDLARRRTIRYLGWKKPGVPNPQYFYALPTYKMARRIAWREIKRLMPPEWLLKPPNESEMLIETKFGSSLYVVGMDKPHRIEGDQWDGGVVDESSDQKPKAFELSILPALQHRNGWCWRIGAAKRFGVGAAEFKEFYEKGVRGDDPDLQSFTWPSTDILTQEQLRWTRENMDARDFDEQFGAVWQSASGLVFYAFSDGVGGNVDPRIQYDPDKPILVGSDFNVDPMCWTLCQEWEGSDGVTELHAFDGMMLRNCNTKLALDWLALRYAERHQGGWIFYGDATGQARKTSASESDYLQIKNDDRFVNKRVRYPRSNPPRKDRFAACNALLLNAVGQRRAKFHPRVPLLKDFGARGYVPGTSEPDDSGDIGHSSDGWGYIVHARYPIKLKSTSQGGVISVS